MSDLAAEYSIAFKAANGYEPTIEANGKRFRIKTANGGHDRYTANDVRNLTRGLRAMTRRPA